MKKYVLHILTAALFSGLFGAFSGVLCPVRAQAASGASREVFTSLPQEVYDSLYRERQMAALKKRMYEDSVMQAYYRIPLFFPFEVELALGQQRSKDAERGYKKFKDTLHLGPIDRFYLDYLDYDFQARMADYGADNLNTHIKYLKMRIKTRDKLIKKYPNQPRAIELELHKSGTRPDNETLLDVYNRMIAADSTFLPTYEQRGDVYWNMGRTEEACYDYYRLPELIQQFMSNKIEACDRYFENRAKQAGYDAKAETETESEAEIKVDAEAEKERDTKPWMSTNPEDAEEE